MTYKSVFNTGPLGANMINIWQDGAGGNERVLLLLSRSYILSAKVNRKSIYL